MSFGVNASCDAAAARAAQAASPAEHPNLVLATTILASGLAFVDGSVVNVGLPTIAASLQADAADLQWVINAYLLPSSALLLFGGGAGDRFGRRRILVLGTVLFAVSSLLCALAPTLSWLLIGRVLQGTGAALLLPNSLAILGESFLGEARGRAIGIWAAAGAIMGAAGPVLGGWLIDFIGWRPIFLINLPLALIAIVLALAFIREPRTDSTKETLDVAGSMLAAVALGALTWGLTVGSGPTGWTSPAITAVALGGALLVVFVILEGRRGDHAMMPLVLFSSATFVGLSLLTLLLYGALGGLFVLLPYLLIEAARYSAAAAGMAMLPFPLVMAIASPAIGAFTGRTGPKLPLIVGSVGVAVGHLLLLRVDANAGYWTSVFPALLAVALGMSCAAAPLTTAVLGSVDERHTGAASGLNSALARVGSLVVIALLGGVLSASGSALVGAFHLAAIVGALLAMGAGLCAIVLISDPKQ